MPSVAEVADRDTAHAAALDPTGATFESTSGHDLELTGLDRLRWELSA